MTDAPRKIWVVRNADGQSIAYHHDDVVRELTAIAKEACGDFREWLAEAAPGSGWVPESLLRLEAALSKIEEDAP